NAQHSLNLRYGGYIRADVGAGWVRRLKDEIVGVAADDGRRRLATGPRSWRRRRPDGVARHAVPRVFKDLAACRIERLARSAARKRILTRLAVTLIHAIDRGSLSNRENGVILSTWAA